ncbi:MAG: hypothetical protein ABI700_03110 [Chloroflexota bacterium]
MYDLDHMLNGNGSRQHLQHMIREKQQEKFARDAEAAQGKDKRPIVARRCAIWVTVIHLIWR